MICIIIYSCVTYRRGHRLRGKQQEDLQGSLLLMVQRSKVDIHRYCESGVALVLVIADDAEQ